MTAVALTARPSVLEQRLDAFESSLRSLARTLGPHNRRVVAELAVDFTALRRDLSGAGAISCPGCGRPIDVRGIAHADCVEVS